MPGVSDSPVELRALRWWDLADVIALEADLFGETAWTAETFWSELAAAGRWYVVLVEKTRPDVVLGYAGLALTGTEADVQTLAVSPQQQGHGYGRMLLDALISEAAGHGALSLVLEVRTDNEAAAALYRSRGFQRLAIRRRYYPDGSDAEVMRLKPLAPERQGGQRS